MSTLFESYSLVCIVRVLCFISFSSLLVLMLNSNICVSVTGVSVTLPKAVAYFNTVGLGVSVYRGVCTLLWLVCLYNLYGLSPYLFTIIGLPVVLLLTVLFYFVLLFYQLSVVNSGNVVQVVPNGCPIVSGVSVFVQVLELISFMVRPLSLGLRVLANLTIGHLLLELVQQVPGVSPVLWYVEMCVALVQGVILVMLVVIYIVEVRLSVVPGQCVLY